MTPPAPHSPMATRPLHLPRCNNLKYQRPFPFPGTVFLRCRERPPCRSSDANGIGKNPLPRGEGGPRQRVGRGMRAGTRKPAEYNRPPPVSPRRRSPGGGLDISENITLPPAFLFSHQSVPRNRLVTASPREKRFCATRWNAGDAVPYDHPKRSINTYKIRAARRPPSCLGVMGNQGFRVEA